jgi:acetoin utilization deacetylase AcuC-like enzyme
MATGIVIISSPGHKFADHPESPDRFSGLGNWDEKPYAGKLLWLESRPADMNRVATIHSTEMMAEVEAACRQAPMIIDYAPTFVTGNSLSDAFNAAGGVLACTQAVLDGQVRNAFAVVRPPGHHAEPQAAMGFCIFNNIAIAARFALEQDLRQVMIVDLDAHHGNGTQAAFRHEDRVTYFSSHQENIYPGSGSMTEAGDARGRIINLPLPPYSGNRTFAMVTKELIIPLVRQRKPDMLFVSVGFDAHWQDPLANLGLSSRGFFQLAAELVKIAEIHCSGRIVFVLEGGYHPKHVAAGVDACLRALTGEEAAETIDLCPYPEADVSERISLLRHLHNLN